MSIQHRENRTRQSGVARNIDLDLISGVADCALCDVPFLVVSSPAAERRERPAQRLERDNAPSVSKPANGGRKSSIIGTHVDDTVHLVMMEKPDGPRYRIMQGVSHNIQTKSLYELAQFVFQSHRRFGAGLRWPCPISPFRAVPLRMPI